MTMRREHIALVILAAGMLGQSGEAAAEGGPALLAPAQPRPVLAAHAFGLDYFPDGPLQTATIGGAHVYFAASGGRRGTSTHGTIALSGTLDELTLREPRGPAGPSPSFRAPSSEAATAAPFANAFDRNYAAGGPVFVDSASGLVLHAYHAEYHPDPKRPFAFYASVGLAVSRDGGHRFQRLGLILRPSLPPEAGRPAPIAVGSFVAVGNALRLYYSDLGPDAGTSDGGTADAPRLPRLAVASADLRAVLAAVQANRLPEFRKWFEGGFVQPGDGGSFTSLFATTDRRWVRWPNVARDAASGQFLLAYAAGSTGIELRTSRDGLQWSDPTLVVASRDDELINYPSLLDLTCDQTERCRVHLTYVSHARHGGEVDFSDRRLMETDLALAVR